MSIAHHLLKVYNTAQAQAKEKYAAEKAAYDASNAAPPQVAPVGKSPATLESVLTSTFSGPANP
jgi:hypothetical protein